MNCDFVGGLRSPIGLDSLVDPSVPKRLLKDFSEMYIFSYVVLEDRIVNYNMNDFSSFPVKLVFHLDLLFLSGRCWLWDDCWTHYALVNCNGDMSLLCYFDSILCKHLLDSPMYERLQFSSRTGPFVDNVLFKVCTWDFIFGIHKDEI